MWASNFLTVEVVYKILYEPYQLSLCYQVPIFHSHIIMWVLPFCQIGLVDNLSKDYGFYQVSKLQLIGFVVFTISVLKLEPKSSKVTRSMSLAG